MTRSISKHLALEKCRIIISLLRKSYFGLISNEDHILLVAFKSLQHKLRYDKKESIDPQELLTPFVALLRASYLSSPFKLAALDAIQTFVIFNILIESPSYTFNALAEVIDAVTKCKYVQTDAVSDELLQLQIIETVYCIIRNNLNAYLNDATTWDIISFSYNTLIQSGIKESFSNLSDTLLFNAAERTLFETSRFIFSNAAIVCHGDNSNKKTLNHTLGLPCALKLLSFFTGILKKHALSKPQQNKIKTPLKTSTSNGKGFTPLGEITNDSETLELLISIKVIYVMLSSRSDDHISKTLLIKCKPLCSMIRDDLSRYMILLTTKRDLSPAILQNILSLFSTLLLSVGSYLRNLIECFMKHVYLKALHQIFLIFQSMEAKNQDAVDISNGFNHEELIIILESLADLISDAGFLPSLFASFDCDPSKSDIMKPLVNYLSRCSSYYLTFTNSEFGTQFSEIAVLCMKCHNHMIKTILDRCQEKGKVNDGVNDANNNIKDSNCSKVTKNLRASRLAKRLIHDAAIKFTQKPEVAFKFLQDHKALPNPLTPSSVAKFLRIAPSLPKEAVGAYLGELGKGADGIEFHRQVLLNYVHSFELKDQSVLNCMRIFLSAFRLPGEAQQIDRILVAFSEYCHANCIEGRSGLLENSEVTYLLTFSIIMLNTDQHNPNIRADRKMTMEQFVRNNTFYGQITPDVIQKVPIAREYLESIYNSIAEYPIRTEKNDITAIMTDETWMDLQLQAEIDPVKGLLITSNSSVDMTAVMRDSLFPELSNSQKVSDISDISDIDPGTWTCNILTSETSYDPLELSGLIYELHGFLDQDIVECIWKELLRVGISPFLTPQLRSKNSSYDNFRLFNDDSELLKIKIGVDVLLGLLQFAELYSLQSVIDTILILLSDLSGMLEANVVVVKVTSALDLGFNLIENKAQKNDDLQSQFILKQMHSLQARAALGTLLQIMHNNMSYLNSVWGLVWYILGSLRDSLLLPRQMVLESDTDLLPDAVRSDFDLRIQNSLRGVKRSSSSVSTVASPMPEKRNSFLSLFSASSSNELDKISNESNVRNEGSKANNSPNEKFFINPQTSRWDEGYQSLESIKRSQDHAERVSNQFRGWDADAPTASDLEKYYYYSYFEDKDKDDIVENSFRNLRELVAICGIDQLVADTKFLSGDMLENFFRAIIDVIGRSDTSVNAEPMLSCVSYDFDEKVDADAKRIMIEDNIFGSLQGYSRYLIQRLPKCSAASCAWMEMLLVEASLRNRDRLSLIWPIISNHYIDTLGNAEKLSFSLERRVSGVFKIATRMISREQMTSPVMELLGAIFNASSKLNTSIDEETNDKIKAKNKLLRDVAELISSGMWRILTLNVSILPLLRLEHWQIIFDIIAVGASAGDYASIKAFEAMAWLLHEPRLRAEVPVFCIVGLKPLLANVDVPVSVSVGTVHLLTHLHTRLEVLAIDESEQKNNSSNNMNQDNETPALWESCWTPIVKTLADGIVDERIPVRLAAGNALAHAILDRHVNAVPPGVLVNILGDIVVPSLLLLGETVVNELDNKGKGNESGKKSKVTSKNTEKEIEKSQYMKEFRDATKTVDESAYSPSKPIVEILCAISTVFLQQLKRLAAYPSFDKLWLRLLHLMGYYLGAPHGFDHTKLKADSPLQLAINGSREQLKNMLRILITGGIFKDRSGLWVITLESVSLFSSCPKLIEELQIK